MSQRPKEIDVAKIRRIFTVVNRFMLGMWHLRLGWLVNVWPSVGGRIMVITHTGRTTGIRRETPVNYAVIDGDVWCTTMPEAAWYKNLVVNPEIEVWLPRGRWRATAQDVPVGADSVPMLRQVLIASGFAAPAFGGIHPRKATDAELLGACAGYHLFRIHRTGRIAGRGTSAAS
ncbi:MAG TPA: nitroreductase/quinone reductase family protein [Propionicimonas sp.]